MHLDMHTGAFAAVTEGAAAGRQADGAKNSFLRAAFHAPPTLLHPHL